jgi:tyrosyl-tRNA synthetase
MWRYAALILCRPDAEIAASRRAVESGEQHPRQVKDALARQIASRFHGEAAAIAAAGEFARVFSEHKRPDVIPSVTIPMAQRENGNLRIVALLVTAGLAESNGAARRLIQQGAVKVDDVKITDVQAELDIPDGCVIQAGKRGFARILSA